MNYIVAIVILNFNAYHETERCVDSILSTSNVRDVSGIVIVDNGSKNESVDYLSQKYYDADNVEIIKSDKNCGFARGNNIGIQYVKRNWNADFVLLLNSDTVMLQPDYIQRLLQQYHKGVGAIQSNVLRTNGRYTARSYDQYNVFGILNRLVALICSYFDIYYPAYVEEYEKKLGFHITGCDWLLTPEYFKVFNRLYPFTFLFCEETILKIMLYKSKLKIKVAENACLLHRESMSTPDSLKLRQKNRMVMEMRGVIHILIVRLLSIRLLKKLVN